MTGKKQVHFCDAISNLIRAETEVVPQHRNKLFKARHGNSIALCRPKSTQPHNIHEKTSACILVTLATRAGTAWMRPAAPVGFFGDSIGSGHRIACVHERCHPHSRRH
jgi:hypothetical protein